LSIYIFYLLLYPQKGIRIFFAVTQYFNIIFSQGGNPRKDFLRCSLEFNGWWIGKTFPTQLGERIGINAREGLNNMEGDLVRLL
jgi:hypothetical protein